jgi:hypothetical protein
VGHPGGDKEGDEVIVEDAGGADIHGGEEPEEVPGEPHARREVLQLPEGGRVVRGPVNRVVEDGGDLPEAAVHPGARGPEGSPEKECLSFEEIPHESW